MTILCEADEETAESLRTVLDGSVQTVDDLPAAALTISLDPAQDVIVVGSDVGIDDVLSFSDQVRIERPNVKVILVRREIDAEIASAAAGVGIRAVVAAGDSRQLSEAYHAARHDGEGVDASGGSSREAESHADTDAESSTPVSGRVITVFSAKGGTGKTTIATNLAVALSSHGRGSVCLVDLDLAFGDVAISMSLSPTRTIVDAVEPDFQGTPEEHLTALLTRYAPGLDCILAPVVPGDDESVPTSLVGFVLRQMRTRYDFVIVDCPSRFSEHVLTALDESDVHFLVTTPSIPSLKNLRLTVDMLDVLGYPPPKRAVLINQAEPKLGVTAQDVSTTARAPIAAELPQSRDVALAVNAGRPIASSKSDHPYSQAIGQLADTLSTGAPSADGRRRIRRRESRVRQSSA
ncbi:MAG TPA: P-loop NTPase [Chloroflexota bacterium]|nr:P-loop NTPase [Chloroflexota bacterium]